MTWGILQRNTSMSTEHSDDQESSRNRNLAISWANKNRPSQRHDTSFVVTALANCDHEKTSA
jgi:hypothetical protein